MLFNGPNQMQDGYQPRAIIRLRPGGPEFVFVKSEWKLRHKKAGPDTPSHVFLQVLLTALQPSHCAGCVKSDALAQGPGLCHGVSGNGYALLSAYKHTKDARYLVRATRFAMWLTEHWQQLYGHADRPLSLYEVGEGCSCWSFIVPYGSCEYQVSRPHAATLCIL